MASSAPTPARCVLQVRWAAAAAACCVRARLVLAQHELSLRLPLSSQWLRLQVPESVCLKSLSYHEAWELSYFGASVLHPRTTMPAMKYSIPISIRNFFNQASPGGQYWPLCLQLLGMICRLARAAALSRRVLSAIEQEQARCSAHRGWDQHRDDDLDRQPSCLLPLAGLHVLTGRVSAPGGAWQQQPDSRETTQAPRSATSAPIQSRPAWSW